MDQNNVSSIVKQHRDGNGIENGRASNGPLPPQMARTEGALTSSKLSSSSLSAAFPRTNEEDGKLAAVSSAHEPRAATGRAVALAFVVFVVAGGATLLLTVIEVIVVSGGAVK